MLIRVRAPNGALRFEVDAKDSVQSLWVRVAERMQLPPEAIRLCRDPSGAQGIDPAAPSLAAVGLAHGDMIFAQVAKDAPLVDLYPSSATPAATDVDGAASAPTSSTPAPPAVVEHPVDLELYKMDGTIERKREGNQRQMRLEDLPIMPYDEKYLAEHKIKHMSFHAMLRQVMDRTKNSGLAGKFSIIDDGIEELIRRTRRQTGSVVRLQDMPPAVQLSRQEYRMVDHVEFDNANIMNTFLDGWRSSGTQRFGYLYGKYMPYSEVPLGIKAVVSCIYEPPQRGSHETIELDDDPDAALVEHVAACLGLERVGCIVTDLTDDGTGRGKVLFTRNFDTYFASGLEVYMAAQMQLAHKSACRYAKGGVFGSKFVSIIATGDESGDIHLIPFQVSNQAVALVAADLVVPTSEPSLMQVAQENDKRIVPEILFSFQNQFGSTVQQTAKPNFPVEFLLVSLTYGFPRDARPLFPDAAFAVEGRPWAPQTLQALASQLKRGNEDALFRTLCDFHAVLFVARENLFELRHELPMLCRAVVEKDPDAMRLVKETDSWKTLVMVLSSA